MATNAISATPEALSIAAISGLAPPPRPSENSSQRPRTSLELPETGQAEGAPGRASVTEAVEQLQATADLVNRGLKFNIDQENNTVQVVILNESTDEIIREIPADEVLKLAQRLQEVIGLIFDKVV